MRAIRVASAALLGVTALTLTAPAAVAGGGGAHAAASFAHAAGPGTIAPGVRSTLPVGECGTDSNAYDAKRGSAYEATFPCGTESGRRHLAVTTGRGNDDGEGFFGDSGRRYRRHGVHAGLGGSIGGFDIERIGLGAALVSGSIGAAWYLWRRRPAVCEPS
ncbi:hypothetical protein ACFSL4_25740 [Streptomyces caeni]|uniref:Uncharacterized protein n=1 Tax=Streptomyces caeni TaxID=2307231 RepID=A0ABW4IVT5_9ACTN